MTESFKTDILILGAGIGGYEVFRTLSALTKRRGIRAHITIVDQNNYFTFVPLLHEVATGSVESTHASIPLRELVYGTPHSFIKATVQKVDQVKKQVHTSSGIISYSYCVIALGSVVNTFGVPGVEEYAHRVRNLQDALFLKYSLVERLENCESGEFIITIVGAGYVGIEIAGQYGTLKNGDLKKLYPHKKIRLRIIDPNNSVLSMMKPVVQKNVQRRLEKMGAEFIFGSSVKKVEETSITLSTGEKLESDLTVWAAGFANIGADFVEGDRCERGRIMVDEYLRIKGDETCYAIGDISCAHTSSNQTPYPQLAEVAHAEGKYVGQHIANILSSKKTQPFVFKSKGHLMPVGDWYGVAIIEGITLYGWVAWWIRRTVYVLYMPGILRKFRIIFDWTIHSLGFGHFIHIEKRQK